MSVCKSKWSRCAFITVCVEYSNVAGGFLYREFYRVFKGKKDSKETNVPGGQGFYQCEFHWERHEKISATGTQSEKCLREKMEQFFILI